jgi:hypothetical protein
MRKLSGTVGACATYMTFAVQEVVFELSNRHWWYETNKDIRAFYYTGFHFQFYTQAQQYLIYL